MRLLLAVSENRLIGALRGLPVQIEACPEWKAAETMQQFAEEMAGTENRITLARQAYTDAVMEYSTLRQMFPNHLLAAAFGRRQDAPLPELDGAAVLWQAPRIKFYDLNNEIHLDLLPLTRGRIYKAETFAKSPSAVHFCVVR